MVKKQSVVDIAAAQIKEYLTQEGIQIGDKLPTEYEMCSKLDVSRATLREVYRELQSQGFLELKAGRGAFVRNKQEDVVQQAVNWFRANEVQMKNYLEVRMYLDPLAAKLAALNRSETDVLVLRQIQTEFEECYARRDNRTMAELDARFHKAIVDITNNDLLTALVQIVNYYFERLRQTSFSLNEHAEHALAPHKRIIEAIASGDPKKAEDESIKHMQIAIQDLCGEEA